MLIYINYKLILNSHNSIMKGLNFKSILTYSYSKSKEEMKRILDFDGFNNL